MTQRTVLTGAVALAALLLAAALVWSGGKEPFSADTREPLFYRHPMNPSITSPVPARDDMGMDYIPVYAGEAEADDALVRISPAMQQNLGVRTAPVRKGLLAREIDTVGYVALDERLLSHVNLRVSGWIEDLQVRTLGQRVKKGDLLFRVYSRELDIAQREYLQTMLGTDTRLREAGAERLKTLGLAPADIRQLERTRQPLPLVPVYARQDGIVAELNAREGAFVTPGTTVMALADLRSVWVLVDIFEQQADWVEVGQMAEMRLPHKPNRVWEGEVEFIYPRLDPKTRTLKVRLRFPNPEEVLRPNMYADVTVHADPREQALSVPSEAVIRTGDGARVIRARGDGGFDPIPVKTGIESADRMEILDGLSESDRVVVSAQFLLDSEASLEASLRRMTEPTENIRSGSSDVVWAEGVVNKVAIEPPTLNLSHAPIPELNWPAMTMDFAVADDVDLSAATPGQTIRFRLRQTGAGQVIVEFEPAE